MILEVKKISQCKEWISMPKQVYDTYSPYVYPFTISLFLELKSYIKKGAIPLLCKRENIAVARVLLCFDEVKRVCYFSHFECIQDSEVYLELMEEVQHLCLIHGIHSLEGPFCPFDPDGRRGLLINSFDRMAPIFCSYNPSYYPDFFESYGWVKKTDTITMTCKITESLREKGTKLHGFLKRSLPKIEVHSLRTSPKLDRNQDLQDILEIVNEASTDGNYVSMIQKEEIEKIYKNLKTYLDTDIILIARDKERNKAVGFVVVLPDWNPIFHDLYGKYKPWELKRRKKEIKRARGMLQYVLPEYQKSGLLGYLFSYEIEILSQKGYLELEGGTIVEDNRDSWSMFNHFDGEMDKRYRIYSMEVKR